jgi:tRNA (guanine-N7-)-methyltransferase
VVEAIRSYHARRGRLSPRQRQALVELAAYDLAHLPDPLDLDAAFGRRAPRILEIGSGMGDAALLTAATHPDIDYIAADVHTKGIARTLLQMQTRGLTNLRVLHGDALDLLTRRLPARCLQQILVYFPDPWPKSRHAKRRLVRPAFADAVVHALVPGGTLHLATDDRDYADTMRDVLAGRPELENTHDGPRVPSRPRTKYEIAGERQGRHATDLVFRVRAPSGRVPERVAPQADHSGPTGDA